MSAQPNENQTLKDKLTNLYYFWCILLAALASYLMPYIMDFYCLRSTSNFITFYNQHLIGNIKYLSLSMLVILCLILILYGISERIDVSVGLPLIFMGVLSYASHIKMLVRDEMVNYQDLFITEAGGIAGSYISWDNSIYFYLMLGFILLVIGLGVMIEITCHNHKKLFSARRHIIVHCATLLAGLLIMFLAVPHVLKSSGSLADQTATIFKASEDSSVLYAFLKSDLMDTSNRSVDEAVASLKEHSSGYQDEGVLQATPNVIIIMNESWWDITPLMSSGITCSEDPMATWNSLSEECITGHVASNVFGGGTISSETEFLMGINIKYFSSDVGISTYLKEETYIPSIVTYFSDLGYDTVAIHPYKRNFYSRDTNYTSYGFDRKVFDEDMKYTDKYDCYISDESLANQIIYEYEQSDNPMFLWSVSIAAHGLGLDSDFYPTVTDYQYPITVDFSDVNLDEEGQLAITRTVNSFSNACKAYQQLVDYFSSVDEPTVILMYGDHCPAIAVELNDLLGTNGVTDSFAENYQMYTTPVLMWSNYDTGTASDEIQIEGENIQYLDVELLKYAGLPDSAMTSIVQYVHSELKSNSLMFLLDQDGTELTSMSDEQKECYVDFGIMENDIIFGDNDYTWLWEMN